ncbi:hypothetical protein [Aurantivibrio infirmus]
MGLFLSCFIACFSIGWFSFSFKNRQDKSTWQSLTRQRNIARQKAAGLDSFTPLRSPLVAALALSMNRKSIFTLELLFILIPISGISVIGGLILLRTLIFEKLRYDWISFFYIIIILISLIGLAVLVIEVTSRIIRKSIMGIWPFRVAMHLGASISALSIFSLLALLVDPQSKDGAGSLGLLSISAPALIPYLHMVYLHKNANKYSQQDAAKDAAPLL